MLADADPHPLSPQSACHAAAGLALARRPDRRRDREVPPGASGVAVGREGSSSAWSGGGERRRRGGMSCCFCGACEPPCEGGLRPFRVCGGAYCFVCLLLLCLGAV